MLHSKTLLVLKGDKSLIDTVSMSLEHVMLCKNRPESERQILYESPYIKYVG